MTQQHQDAVLKIVRQMRSQLDDSQMEADTSQTTTTTSGDRIPARLHDLYETLNILAGGVEALNDDGQRLNNESLQSQIFLQALSEQFSNVKLSVEESHSFLQGVKHNQDILKQDLESMKEKINDMQYVSYDGTYVWRIANFREK
ncbi:MAG: hypothetical protein ACYTX0_50015, partial [Nostoc sp.]